MALLHTYAWDLIKDTSMFLVDSIVQIFIGISIGLLIDYIQDGDQ